MASVTTSLVVQFGASAGQGLLLLELDPTQAGSFGPGDLAKLQMFKTSNVSLLDAAGNPVSDAGAPIVSAGSITKTGTGVRTITEELTFANTNSATLSHPITGALSVTWLGASLGNLAISDEFNVKAANTGVAVAKVSYSSPYVEYTLQSPATLAGLSNFSIVVFLSGTAV